MALYRRARGRNRTSRLSPPTSPCASRPACVRRSCDRRPEYRETGLPHRLCEEPLRNSATGRRRRFDLARRESAGKAGRRTTRNSWGSRGARSQAGRVRRRRGTDSLARPAARRRRARSRKRRTTRPRPARIHCQRLPARRPGSGRRTTQPQARRVARRRSRPKRQPCSDRFGICPSCPSVSAMPCARLAGPPGMALRSTSDIRRWRRRSLRTRAARAPEESSRGLPSDGCCRRPNRRRE